MFIIQLFCEIDDFFMDIVNILRKDVSRFGYRAYDTRELQFTITRRDSEIAPTVGGNFDSRQHQMRK